MSDWRGLATDLRCSIEVSVASLNIVLSVQNAPTAAYSITLKISLDNVPGTLGRFAAAVGDVGGNIAAIPGFEAKGPTVVRDIDVLCRSEAHAAQVASAVDALEGVMVLDWWDRTYALHEGGKIEVLPLLFGRRRG